MNLARAGGSARTYRRSLGTRLLGAVAALLFPGAAVSALWVSGLGPAFLVCGALGLLSLANLVTAWGDRFTLADEGIEYRNSWLARLGVRPRRLAWDEVERVREHERRPRGRRDGAPRAVLLIPRSGRRLVLDSLEHFDEVLRTVHRRCVDRDPVR